MTSQEFVIWLKGFTEGVHEYNVTPKQWDLLKERLAEVNDNDDDEYVEIPGTFQDHTLQSYPPYWSPYSPFHVTSLTGSGTVSTPGFAVTTTPNYVTAYNPITVRTSGYLSASFVSPITSTATNFPPGTTVTYTNNGSPTWYSINKIENDSREK